MRISRWRATQQKKKSKQGQGKYLQNLSWPLIDWRATEFGLTPLSQYARVLREAVQIFTEMRFHGFLFFRATTHTCLLALAQRTHCNY